MASRRSPHSNYPPFHLSVNRDGLVSLWDTEAKAHSADADEEYVRLELTVEQVHALEEATDIARHRGGRR